MKIKDFNNIIIGKVLQLTKQIHLKQPENGSGMPERFMTGKSLAHPFLSSSSFGMEWWTTQQTSKCCDDIAEIALSYDPALQGGDRESFSEMIMKILRENVEEKELFTFESIFLSNANTLFEARVIENPREFASKLWNQIRSNFTDSLVTWLTIYPLRLVKADSFILGFDGLILLRANDQEQWEKLSKRYFDAKFWNPSVGGWERGIDNHTMKDFVLTPTWLACEASGATSDSTRNLVGDHIRTFIAILCSYFDDKIPDLLTKSGAIAASYSIQFPDDGEKAGCGSVSAPIGNLFPPLLLNEPLNVSPDVLREIQDWYISRSKALESAAQRATTAAHFVHYGIVYDGVVRFIHFFTSLDALFGERNKVEKNLKEGIRKTFPGQSKWEERAEKLFDLRNELVHGGISSINRWKKLNDYRRHFKSDPMKDIQTAAMTALRVYFVNRVFEHLFETEL